MRVSTLFGCEWAWRREHRVNIVRIVWMVMMVKNVRMVDSLNGRVVKWLALRTASLEALAFGGVRFKV